MIKLGFTKTAKLQHVPWKGRGITALSRKGSTETVKMQRLGPVLSDIKFWMEGLDMNSKETRAPRDHER